MMAIVEEPLHAFAQVAWVKLANEHMLNAFLQ
jgi:hypothetical protein